LPLILILRNRLKYALTKAEANAIVKQKFVKVDGKTRTDVSFPAGFMGESTMKVLVRYGLGDNAVVSQAEAGLREVEGCALATCFGGTTWPGGQSHRYY
jgi:hypothetical protein